MQCDDAAAIWLLRAVLVENICARREESVLYLPAGPAFRLGEEFRNVVTAVAKCWHSWGEHQGRKSVPLITKE